MKNTLGILVLLTSLAVNAQQASDANYNPKNSKRTMKKGTDLISKKINPSTFTPAAIVPMYTEMHNKSSGLPPDIKMK